MMMTEMMMLLMTAFTPVMSEYEMLRQDPDWGSSWILLRIILNATSLLLSSPEKVGFVIQSSTM